MQTRTLSLSQFRESISRKLPTLANKRVLVVGDVGIDKYVWGDVKRISPEAPVPVLEVTSEEARIGMAANVAANVQSLGGQAILVGVVGRDSAGEELSSLLKAQGVSSEHLVIDPERPTTRKMRALSSHHHLLRIDYEHKKILDSDIEKKVLLKVAEVMPHVESVILEDYAKGVLSENLMAQIIAMAKASKKMVFADPHRTTPLNFYSGVDVFKPNRDEAYVLLGRALDDFRDHPDSLFLVGEELRKRTRAETVIVTRGREGMSLFSATEVVNMPTTAVAVADVTGAGDTVSAAIGLGCAAGFDLAEACVLANFAAGIVVGKIGCATCTPQEIKEWMETNL